MAYRRSAQADEDYVAIYQYGLATYGIVQAEAYADRLDAAFDLLGSFPRAARLRREIEPPVRAHPVGAHLVVYDVDANEDVVILRIPHARSDWTND